jgi:hypothetical protein
MTEFDLGKELRASEPIRQHVKKSQVFSLGAIAIFALIGIGMDLSDHPGYEKFKGWGLVIVGISLVVCCVPTIIRCAAGGYRNIWTVAASSIFILAVSLIIFYTSYYWITGTDPAGNPLSEKSDKILSFPPLISAIILAGIGWYIHFQASAKNARTTNSFQLVMQTRTSKEFLDRASRAQIAYPFGAVAPKEHAKYIEAAVFADLRKKHAESSDADPGGKKKIEEELKIADNVDAIKYLLNFYEFMAVGVEFKDLEEWIIYDTLGVTVTSMYRRSEPFVSHIRNHAATPQKLAFSNLEKLVVRWELLLKREKDEKERIAK